MTPFASNLRRRAEDLGISHAEAARRAGLSERRYANYVNGKREPDLQTLVKIAFTLGTTPDRLLGITDTRAHPSAPLLDRLILAAREMDIRDLEAFVAQAEVIKTLRRTPT